MEKGTSSIPIQEEPSEVGIVKREFKGAVKIYISIVSVGLALFELYTAYFGILDPLKQVSVFAIFILAIGFIIYPFSKERVWGKWFTFDIILSIVAVSIPLYLLIFHDVILLQYGDITLMETFMAYVMVFLFLELGRRSMGYPLPLITFLFLLYALVGRIIPGPLGHSGIDIKYLASSLFVTNQGIWGLPMSVTAKYIYLFILFGTISVTSGCGELIIKCATALAGKSKGGAAKIAILASGFFGSISGSAVANVVTTGSFTIPMMKKLGFKPSFAGAVEATASTGGIIMPPVMGAVAFIMAELMNVSYFDIVKAAFLPAVLYYFSVFWMIHLRATKIGLKSLKSSEVPNFFGVIKKEVYLFLPLLVLVYYILIKRMSPQISVFWALVTILIIFWLRIGKEKYMFFRKLVDCFESSAKIAVSLTAAVAMAGIIMDTVMLTGLALRLSSIVISIAGGSIILVLLITMIASLVLGMGVTASVAYIIPAILVVPILVKSGILPMAANLFAFYFAVISYITPPVAIASYAAAGIANADMFETSYAAFKLGLAGFIVPFMFVFNPSLIMIGTPLKIFTSFDAICISIMMLGISIEGFALTRVSLTGRLLCFMGALLLIDTGYITDIIGVTILLLIYIKQRFALHKRIE